jgi:integrase
MWGWWDMDSNGTPRRQRRGSAWYWKQTRCWYYTPPGTKQRVPLLDEDGQRVRGKDNRKGAELALARVKLARQWRPTAATADREEWLVARVCSQYLKRCQTRMAAGALSSEYAAAIIRHLNALCEYCGGLPVSQLNKGHVQLWIDQHSSWRSPATRRNVLVTILAAFRYAQEMHDVPNPLRGLKKPPAQPRLHSLSPEDEQALYQATDACFGDFLFAAMHTGLRPFCELAKLTADDVEETKRGMMWRMLSTKNHKIRKIPVRPEVARLTRRLTKTAPSGSGLPLFRNVQGSRWKKVTGVARFLRLKRKLGWNADPLKSRYSCYSCRHTFAHRMLSGYWNGGVGCSIETLAELLGDTPKVAFDHYGRQWSQHYQEPLWAAVGLRAAEAAPSRPAKRHRKAKATAGRKAAPSTTTNRRPQRTSNH